MGMKGQLRPFPALRGFVAKWLRGFAANSARTKQSQLQMAQQTIREGLSYKEQNENKARAKPVTNRTGPFIAEPVPARRDRSLLPCLRAVRSPRFRRFRFLHFGVLPGATK